MKNYKYKKNSNITEDDYLSSNKESNTMDDNYYLTKYHKMFGNSLSDSELLDIFIKNNYNDKQIVEDIKSMLRNEKKYEYYSNNNNYNNYNIYERNNYKSKSKSRGKKNKYEKRPFTKCIEIPSDYAPPPKKEEESNDDKNIGSQNEDQEMNNKKSDNDNNKLNDYKEETLLAYKENLFRILKNPKYSYKPNNNKNDEMNANDYENNENQKKIINLSEKAKNKNIKIENNSPGPECKPNKKNKINQNINKDLKKKYIRDFFGNMKNYSNNIRRENWEKSPDLNRRENVLDTSPDKEDAEHKILTYKKNIKNYYSNETDYKYNKFNKNKDYKYLIIENKVNDIFISACYDNPQRDQYLKVINEKRKQNPDKVIEFLIPQFPPMFPMTPYQNMYSQYNPYMNMNMYMMPPPQMPNPMMNIMSNSNNNPAQNVNINNSNKSNNNNNVENNETPDRQNSLTQTQVMQLNNNNQINVKINNTPNPNALLINNNNDMNNSKSKNSSDNVSNSGNSGNNNNIDAKIHL